MHRRFPSHDTNPHPTPARSASWVKQIRKLPARHHPAPDPREVASWVKQICELPARHQSPPDPREHKQF